MTAPAVGIDLGTTYSCVAVFRNGRSEIIANAQGNRITPSVVSFGKERLVGEPAKNQEASNPKNTVFGIKRLIGRRWEDPSVQQDIKLWPFEVVNETGRPKVLVKHEDEERRLFPEEISAMVLGCMKNAAEAYLGKPVRNAVVTVPAYFNDSQRQATKDAATIAGLNVLRIINEPTAAALAYGLEQPLEEERNVLIFDLGGGTFDVSVLCIEEGIFEVKSTAGDTHLGGEDIDGILTKHYAEEFKNKHGYDIQSDATSLAVRKSLARLRRECERAKRMLSSAMEVTIELDSLYEGQDFSAVLTRAHFEELCGDLLRRTLEPVRQALFDAQLGVADINEIVLVGGSTRIPMVQKLLKDFFEGRELTQTLNPDEAVAAGAAIQAASLDGDPSETITDLVLLDVTPLSLGTTLYGGIMDVIIPKNTPIPVKQCRFYSTACDNQSSMDVEIREGERMNSSENNLLGRYILSGLPRGKAGTIHVKDTFEIDADGILHVSSMEITNNVQNNITIEKGRLTKEEIERMIEEAQRFEKEDLLWKETMEVKNCLELFCRSLINRLAAATSSASREQLKKHCDETLRWLTDHPRATVDEYAKKRRDLELLCDMTDMVL